MKLREIRENYRGIGMTMGELSRRSGVHKNVISRLELGKADIMNTTIGVGYRLARELDCNIDDFLDDEDKAKVLDSDKE